MNNMREIQRFMIDPTVTREQTIITVSNPDGGTYTISFLYSKTNTYWTTDQISTNASASSFYYAVYYFYSYYYGAPISVGLVMYDASDNVVTSMTNSVKNEYTITVKRSLSSVSARQINFKKLSTSATLTRIRPSDEGGTKSSTPLSGSFTLTCYLADGTTNTT